jgi:hypothetical protein
VRVRRETQIKWPESIDDPNELFSPKKTSQTTPEDDEDDGDGELKEFMEITRKALSTKNNEENEEFVPIDFNDTDMVE